MAFNFPLTVYVMGVTRMYRVKEFSKPLIGFGCHNEMDMICHQAVGRDFYAIFWRVFIDELNVILIIAVLIKNIHAVITPLSDMMGFVWDDDSCLSWHVSILCPMP